MLCSIVVLYATTAQTQVSALALVRYICKILFPIMQGNSATCQEDIPEKRNFRDNALTGPWKCGQAVS